MPAKKASKPTPKQKQKKAREIDDESENEYNSDALDDDSGEERQKKRKRNAEVVKKIRSPKKKKVVDTDEEEFDLQDGQEVVGVVVKAPKTGIGTTTHPRQFLPSTFPSSSWANFAEHVRFFDAAEGPKVQRSRMVRAHMLSLGGRVISSAYVRFKLHGRPDFCARVSFF